EKEFIEEMRSLQQEIENLSIEEKQHEREGNYSKAAEIKHGRLPEAEAKLAELSKKLSEIQEDSRLLREEVSEEDIAKVVSSWTGIPVSKMLASERSKLLELEEILGNRVIGQRRAIEAVSDAIRRNKSGISDINRPTGTFLFIGPTGVGKTETAKTIAEFLFDDEHALRRIDMSEYMEKHTVSRLIGAPPGYVGYEQGGQLTETVRRRPYSVILFDEIEKAHPDVFNVLLQLLDEGRLTDGQGRQVDFRNTIIILTSNLGSDLILNAEEVSQIEDQIGELLHRTFKPEFLNRLDEIIMYERLGKKELKRIVDLELKRVEARLSESRISLKVSEKAKQHLAEVGYDPAFGARPLKRAIQTHLQNPLAKLLLRGDFGEGTTVGVDFDGRELTFSEVAGGETVGEGVSA
ncbi:MAG: AAA family ATPase, partial [Spirochaetaceae bacterium]